MDIRQTVLKQMRLIAAQQNKTLLPLTDDVLLLDSGLDSLCIAILVASLDDELSVDPFSSDSVAMPTTVGQFIDVYQQAALV